MLVPRTFTCLFIFDERPILIYCVAKLRTSYDIRSYYCCLNSCERIILRCKRFIPRILFEYLYEYFIIRIKKKLRANEVHPSMAN